MNPDYALEHNKFNKINWKSRITNILKPILDFIETRNAKEFPMNRLLNGKTELP